MRRDIHPLYLNHNWKTFPAKKDLDLENVLLRKGLPKRSIALNLTTISLPLFVFCRLHKNRTPLESVQTETFLFFFSLPGHQRPPSPSSPSFLPHHFSPLSRFPFPSQTPRIRFPQLQEARAAPTMTSAKDNLLPQALVSNLQEVLLGRKSEEPSETTAEEAVQPSTSEPAGDCSKPVVLVTNGDGIESPGLTFLVEALVREGLYDVHVCAPQS